MKKIMVLLCVFGLLLIPVNSFAQSDSVHLDKLKEADSDYSEIVSLNEEILEQLRTYGLENGVKLPDDYHIDFRNAIKIFIDTNIFTLETTDKEVVMQELNRGSYVWLLPINVAGSTYEVCIAKGLPLDESIKDFLTKNEIQEIKEREGRWIATSFGIPADGDEPVSFEQEIAQGLETLQYDAKEAEVIICGGLPNIHYPVALVMNQDKVDLTIPLYPLTIEGSEEELGSIKPIGSTNENQVYLYEGVMKAVNQMEAPGEETIGGAFVTLDSDDAGNSPFVTITIAVAALASMVMGYVIVRKHSKNQGNYGL